MSNDAITVAYTSLTITIKIDPKIEGVKFYTDVVKPVNEDFSGLWDISEVHLADTGISLSEVNFSTGNEVYAIFKCHYYASEADRTAPILDDITNKLTAIAAEWLASFNLNIPK